MSTIELSSGKVIPTNSDKHLSISEDLNFLATPQGTIKAEVLDATDKHELALIMLERWSNFGKIHALLCEEESVEVVDGTVYFKEQTLEVIESTIDGADYPELSANGLIPKNNLPEKPTLEYSGLDLPLAKYSIDNKFLLVYFFIFLFFIALIIGSVFYAR